MHKTPVSGAACMCCTICVLPDCLRVDVDANNKGIYSGRQWRDANGSSRYGEGGRQSKSVYFLPPPLQEANPWDDAGGYEDVRYRNDGRHRDYSPSYPRNSHGGHHYRDDYTDDYRDRDDRRDYHHRNDYRDRDKSPTYEEQKRNRWEDGYFRDGGWDDYQHGHSGYSRRSEERDRGYRDNKQYDDRYRDDRNSSPRGRYESPEKLTREQWRQLEREEWLREQERNARRYDSRRDYSPQRHSRYDDERDYDNRHPRDSHRDNRGRNQNYSNSNAPNRPCSSRSFERSDRNYGPSAHDERSKPAQRRGRRRSGRESRGAGFGGNSGFRAERGGFGTNNYGNNRSGFGGNSPRDSQNFKDSNVNIDKSYDESERHEYMQMVAKPEQDVLPEEKDVVGIEEDSRSRDDEDVTDAERKAFEQLSIDEGQNSLTARNSDTESDAELKPRQELQSDGDIMPTASGTVSVPIEPGAVMIAPKKSPATREGKQKVRLLTNFWEISVKSKMVYRYDVAVYLGTPTNERAIDLLRGPRDDSAAITRHRLCMDALRYALEFYRILSRGAAVIHDGAAMMFSSEDLAAALKEHSGVLMLDKNDLPESIRKLIYRVDIKTVTIEIMPCRIAAASFDIADLSAQKNRNWATLDRSWKQFYDLITNQDAVISGRFTQFGAGCLYYSNPLPDRVGFGYERFSGARKGIKFIEGKKPEPNNVVAALILDHRVGMFFKNQNLMCSIRELNGLRNVDRFDFSRKTNGRMNNKWCEVNQYVKGVRLNYLGSGSAPLSFVAIGISEVPIKELKDTLPNNARTEVSVLTKFSDTRVRINPDWPAVKYRNRGQIQHFPMELLEVAPNQRVSLEKQQIANSAPRADKPNVRLEKIHTLLEALNLHDSGYKNQFLRAFGIEIACAPKRVEGFRRSAPGIAFGGNRISQVDQAKCNWKQERDTKYVSCARVERIIIVHSDQTGKLPGNVERALSSTFRSRGIHCGRFDKVLINSGRDQEMEGQLQQVFEKNKGSKSLLIIYIDRAENKSHEFLKLMERKYLIPTQQMTAELAGKILEQRQSCGNFVSKTNLKLGGINYEVIPESFAKNRWIAGGRTMVVGYDVAHPGKPTRDEVMNRMPPQRPSVVGFSFNGAAHPECFIGDYHFQLPRREKVDHTVLNARFKWMLELFVKNRKVWPENIVITRDGVSEGQYRMVIEDELGAIKEACEEFGRLNGRDPWLPRFTVVVATKRHNARFFVENGRFIDNPQPATVVDNDVVRNDITEFYMQSHRPVQGTAKPTSYQLIVDENDMGSDEVQSLMLALCFHHQIVDAPVSIPEPVYQADEWAKRGKDIWKAYT
ncbi:hypothetical protein Y032_0175g510 [Ancylostoma ceylanicum]|uniref:Piwi domain-containing protein n=1 Tax=Ancylostoma ceylanicum TaxID=53326 RepID=A0A016SUR0_9BILA|nr:hypothetical protein Y032_0175g510 [Ancylostoma ceylanicum]